MAGVDDEWPGGERKTQGRMYRLRARHLIGRRVLDHVHAEGQATGRDGQGGCLRGGQGGTVQLAEPRRLWILAFLLPLQAHQVRVCARELSQASAHRHHAWRRYMSIFIYYIYSFSP